MSEFDQEEQEILEAVEAGNVTRVKDTAEIQERHQAYAEAMFRKDAPINIEPTNSGISFDMKNKVCPKCESSEIIEEAEVRDHDASSYRPLGVHVKLANPTGGFIKKTHVSGELRAWICGACGYTELYATNYQELLKARQ